MMVANRRTKAMGDRHVAFFDIERFMKDIDVIVDTARGRALSFAQIGLSFVRNFDEKQGARGPDAARDARAVRAA